jgi:hypothetical protein
MTTVYIRERTCAHIAMLYYLAVPRRVIVCFLHKTAGFLTLQFAVQLDIVRFPAEHLGQFDATIRTRNIITTGRYVMFYQGILLLLLLALLLVLLLLLL